MNKREKIFNEKKCLNINKKNTSLEQLDQIIANTVENISNFTKRTSDFTRNRKLNATTTIKTILNMQGNSLNTELIEAFPNLEDRMTASAFEQAKGKLKPEIFEHILAEYNKTMSNIKLRDDKYRVFAIDGSDFNPPYNENSDFVMQTSVGRPKKNGENCKPYSLVHANLLYDIENRIYQECLLQPNSSANEREAAIDMLKRLDIDNPYIVIMDRGYDGFNMIENCNRLKNCNYVIRTKSGKGGIKEIAELPAKECDVEMEFEVVTSNKYYSDNHKNNPYLHYVNAPKKHYKKYFSPATKNQRWDFEWRCMVKCRVVKFRINNADTGREEWEVLITNLNRVEFPIRRMKELYFKRWNIETSFRELKYALGAIQFHSKKDDFIKMELFAHLIMFNAVSRNIASVKVPQQKNNKYHYAVNFKEACTITRKYYRFYNVEPQDRIYAEILSYTVPVRKGRTNKRNKKQKSSVWFVHRVA